MKLPPKSAGHNDESGDGEPRPEPKASAPHILEPSRGPSHNDEISHGEPGGLCLGEPGVPGCQMSCGAHSAGYILQDNCLT